MAIAFRIASTAAATATSVAPAKPVGLADGDVLVAVSNVDANETITAPGGWTACFAQEQTGSQTVRAWYRVVASAASETSTYTFGGTASVARVTTIVCYSGVDNTTPMDVTALASNNASSTTIHAASITTVTNGAVVVWAGAIDSSTFTVTKPTACTNRNQATANYRLTMADLAMPTAGATGSQDGSVSTARVNVGALIALRPASGNINVSGTTSTVTSAANVGTQPRDIPGTTSIGTATANVGTAPRNISGTVSTALSAANVGTVVESISGTTSTAIVTANAGTITGPASASITIGASSHASGDTVSKPTGTVNGNVMVAAVSSNFNDLIAPTGWVFQVESSSNGNEYLTLFTKTASSEPSSYTWGSNLSAFGGMIYQVGITTFAGADTNALDGTPTTGSFYGSGADTVTASSLTTTSNNSILVQAAFSYNYYTDTTDIVPDAAMTEQWDDIVSSAQALNLTTELRATAGATGSRTATITRTGGGAVFGSFATAMLALQIAVPTISVNGTTATVTTAANVGTLTYGANITGTSAVVTGTANAGALPRSISGVTASASIVANVGAVNRVIAGIAATVAVSANAGSLSYAASPAGTTAVVSVTANVGTRTYGANISGTTATVVSAANAATFRFDIPGTTSIAVATANAGVVGIGAVVSGTTATVSVTTNPGSLVYASTAIGTTATVVAAAQAGSLTYGATITGTTATVFVDAFVGSSHAGSNVRIGSLTRISAQQMVFAERQAFAAYTATRIAAGNVIIATRDGSILNMGISRTGIIPVIQVDRAEPGQPVQVERDEAGVVVQVERVNEEL